MITSMLRRAQLTAGPAPGGPPSPSWSLDFSTGTPSGYTLTRASSATRVDSSGYIASSATDVARLTHNSSGSRLGLLVEPQRTNLFQRSAEFDNAFWAKENAAVTANSVTSPENTTTADTLADNSTSGRHIIYDSRSGDLSTRRTFSVFAKKNSLQYVLLCITNSPDTHAFAAIFNLDNGTVSDTKTVGSGTITATIENYGNGWYRCVISGTQTTGTANYYPIICTSDRAGFTGALVGGLFPSYSGSGQSLYIWGAQLEEAANASAYIPTTTASVTRQADISYVETADVTNWGRPGSFVVEYYKPIEQSGGVVVADDDDAGNSGRLGLEYSSGGPRIVYGTSGASGGATDSAGLNKVGWAWDGSGAATRSAINGAAWSTSIATSFDPSNTDAINLGGNIDWTALPLTVSGQPNVVIRKVQFYNSQLSAADLNTLTT